MFAFPSRSPLLCWHHQALPIGSELCLQRGPTLGWLRPPAAETILPLGSHFPLAGGAGLLGTPKGGMIGRTSPTVTDHHFHHLVLFLGPRVGVSHLCLAPKK